MLVLQINCGKKTRLIFHSESLWGVKTLNIALISKQNCITLTDADVIPVAVVCCAL